MNTTHVVTAHHFAQRNQAIAAFMDDMAVQMDMSAVTIRSSSPDTKAGNLISKAASGIEERASQIRTFTREFRSNGDMANFDQACKIAGWNPSPDALESLMAQAASGTIQ
jgi:hypothetical protein